MAELALKWEHDWNGRRTWKTLPFAILPIHQLRILFSLFSIKCMHAYIHIYKCICIYIHHKHTGASLCLCPSLSHHTHSPLSSLAMKIIWYSYIPLCQRSPIQFELYAESGQQLCFIWPEYVWTSVLNVCELPIIHLELQTMSHDHPYTYYGKFGWSITTKTTPPCGNLSPSEGAQVVHLTKT